MHQEVTCILNSMLHALKKNRFPEYLIKLILFHMRNHILIEEDEVHKIVMR